MLAIESEITLSSQERAKEWEYRACLPRRLRRRQVLAVNKAGEGRPGNTVMAVLWNRMTSVTDGEPEMVMDNLAAFWEWLLDPNNRGRLAIVGTAFAAVIGAGWAVFVYVRKRKDTPRKTDASNRTTNFNQPTATQYVERMEGGSVTIDAGPSAEQIQAIIEPLLAANQDQATRITQLSVQLGVSEAAVRGFFDTLGKEQVPPERWANALAEIAQSHLSLLKRLESLPADDATIAKKKRAAREAVASGDHQRADALLEACEQLDLEASQRATEDAKSRLRRAAETRAARGDLAMTRIDYRGAADHFGRAVELADGLDAELQNRFLHKRADALYKQGEERGDNAALNEAIGAWRDLLDRRPREPLPLDWAMTQNNLGNALRRLGERESGTTRLEEAVAAYREALAVFEAAGADYYIAVVQRNLERVERLLEQRQ